MLAVFRRLRLRRAREALGRPADVVGARHGWGEAVRGAAHESIGAVVQALGHDERVFGSSAATLVPFDGEAGQV